MTRDSPSPPVLPLPVEKMPDCWNQDERMNALFSQFRNRSVNPQDWNSKYKFWDNLIAEWLEHKMTCSFSLSDLNVAFKRKGCTPLCLSTVMQELSRNGEIILESDFLKSNDASWTAWTLDLLVRKPLTWSFSKVKTYLVEETIDSSTRYVHLKTIKKLGELILSTMENKKENVLLPLSEITKNCREKAQNPNVTEQNVKLALIWLRRLKKAAFRCDPRKDDADVFVKISQNSVDNVSEAEEGLYKLMKQENQLIKTIECLEREKHEVLLKAKSSLDGGLRQVARSYLRKKKDIEKRMEKHANTLLNLQTLIGKIHDSHSDADVLTAYRTGIALLKRLEDTGLTEENARNAVDDMSEAFEDYKEIQSALSQSVEIIDSDSELEKELADLLAAEDEGSTTKSKETADMELPELEDKLSSVQLKDLPSPVKFPTPPSSEKRSRVEPSGRKEFSK